MHNNLFFIFHYAIFISIGYIIRPHYTLVRRRVVNNYKQKKAKYLEEYENQKGKMSLAEIKSFLSVRASFVSHIKHANSYNLINKVGTIDETNPFDAEKYCFAVGCVS